MYAWREMQRILRNNPSRGEIGGDETKARKGLRRTATSASLQEHLLFGCAVIQPRCLQTGLPRLRASVHTPVFP